jgi:predicted O-linked N-acetylglucosamine transferase (SPINDLY family)
LRDSLNVDALKSAQEIEELVGFGQPFYLAYQAQDDTPLQRLYGSALARMMQRWRDLAGIEAYRPPPGRRRIRIGVVSALLRHHSVWHANVRGFAAHLPRDRFEVFGYRTETGVGSEAGTESALFDRFVAGNLPLHEWVARIQRDAPDVLYYPEIGMDPRCLKLAALRLAPIQITGWGHPVTTGLPVIDYYLSGELFEPPHASAHYTETLVRLPGLGVCYVPVGAKPAHAELRASGVPGDGAPLYVCCQSVFKYLPEHDRVFPDIAAEVGHCRFVFVNDSIRHRAGLLRARVSAAFAARGLDAERYCSFIDPLPLTQFLGLLRQSDVHLDTIGFSGFSTAMMALEQSCPVVTVEGEYMRGRLASGVLRRAGLDETIAADRDHYVRIAAELGRDRVRRSRLGKRIPAAMKSLMDDRTPVAALGEFLERAVAKR